MRGESRDSRGSPWRWRLPVAIAAAVTSVALALLGLSRVLRPPEAPPAQDWLGVDDSTRVGASPELAPEQLALKSELTGAVRQVLADYPETVEAIDVAALLHLRLDRVDQAERCWQRCLELAPQSPAAHFALGSLARKKGQDSKAADHFAKAAEVDTQSPQLRFELAEALINQGEFDRAKAVVEKNLQSAPRFFPALYQLGRIHLQRKDYAQARQVLEEAIRYGPDFAATYFSLSTACARLGDAQQAERYMERFRTLRARDEQAHVAELKAAGDTEAGMRRIAAEIFTATSQVYLMHSQSQAAERLLKRACQLGSDYVECADLLAQLYQQEGRAAEALAILSRAHASSPKSLTILVHLGTLGASLGRFEEAEQAFHKAIELSPGEARAYAMLAKLYLEADRKLPEARRLVEKAVELQPEPSLYRLLGLACEKTGDAAGARAAREKSRTPAERGGP